MYNIYRELRRNITTIEFNGITSHVQNKKSTSNLWI